MEDPRKGSGRTTRQLQRLVKELKAHPSRYEAVYVVHADRFVDQVEALLVKHCGLTEPRWKRLHRGHFVDQHSGGVLRIQAVPLTRWFEEEVPTRPGLLADVDHHAWDVDFSRRMREIARRYPKDLREGEK